VTRSEVLKALTILHKDGIIERVTGQASGFRPILNTQAAIDDSPQFLLVLEPTAILAPGFAQDQKRARHLRLQIDKALGNGDIGIAAAAFHPQDTAFHHLIAEGPANRFARAALLARHSLRQITQKD